MRRDPLKQLSEALLNPGAPAGGAAQIDIQRQERTGTPEIVLAEHKTPAQTIAGARLLLERSGYAIISRIPAALLLELRVAFAPPITWEQSASGQLAIVRTPGYAQPASGGQVGILTAGTSDVALAEEAAALCQALGCQVHTGFDVGVAGLHRLIQPLRAMLAAPVDVLIVAAGMDGALPSVVAGLVDVPVIGLPSSVGYGMGGRGEAALLAMLQTCVPGLTVVNIDNSVGAAAVAARIANQVAAARSGRASD